MKMKMILAEKGKRSNIESIPADAVLRDAAELMCEQGVGAVLVTAPENPEKYVGIISERDLLRKCCTDDNFRERKIEDVMTRDLLIAKDDDDVEYVKRIMANRHIRHMPVIDENSKITGLVSIRDILKTMIEEDMIRIRHLSDYLGTSRRNEVY
jgi:CBS domain-containing protein